MTTKTMLYAGGAAVVVGGLAMYALRHARAGAPVGTPPVVDALGVPTMPAPASFPPQNFDLSDTPYFQTINYPGARLPNPKETASADGKSCCTDCSLGNAALGPQLTPDQLNNWATKVGRLRQVTTFQFLGGA